MTICGKAIGIDLGTTNSAVAGLDADGKAAIIENMEGRRTTPSMYAIEENGQELIGDSAKRQAVINPLNTYFGTKRLMGHKYADEAVQSIKKMVQYGIGSGPNGDAVVLHVSDGKPDRQIQPQVVASKILALLSASADKYSQCSPGEKRKAVITVPAYFNDAERQATKDAGTIAGLDVIRIINEPTAAALAYGVDKNRTCTIAVYDLGGGTFDVSILDIGDGVIEVRATTGDTFLGGYDFDHKLAAHLVDEFKKQSGIDVSNDKDAMQKLLNEAELAKMQLSSLQTYQISLPFLAVDTKTNTPKHFKLELTRAKLEMLVDALLKRTVKPCKEAMESAKVNKVDDVLLVGGMTRMPAVRKLAKEIFGIEPNQGVNPDEAVAMGAAIQAGILGGDVRDLLLLDVTSLSLGIETLGGVLTPIIERNTTIPTSKSQVFSTAADSQTSVVIKVYQGERPMASDNKFLGTFELSGIPPAPRGIPQIEVTFDIDANGIVNVSAKDKASGKTQNIRIQTSGGMSKEEVERLVKEAEQHAEQDKQLKRVVEMKNQAESLVYSAGRSLEEYKDKVSAEDKEAIEKSIQHLRELLDKQDVTEGELQTGLDALNRDVQKIGQSMYGGAANQAGPDDNQGTTDQ